MRRLLNVLWVTSCLQALAANPPVQVSLTSSWPATPALIEILETIGLEDPDAFFPLLNLLTDPEVLPSRNISPEAIHQAALQVALSNGLLAQPGSVASVEMNLALHSASPKVEAFYSYYTNHYNNTKGNECGSWVDWYGDVVCDVETLARLAGVDTIDSGNKQSSYPHPKTLAFDHIHPPSDQTVERPARTAILYASLTSPNFRDLHSYLYKLSSRPDSHVEYILRHIPPKDRDTTPNTLSGYGVALDLKKTDYLAIDDRLSKSAGSRKQNSQSQEDDSSATVDPIVSLLAAYPENSTTTALTKEEFALLGPKAVQLIADSSNPLETLTKLSQDFPRYATSVARRVIPNAQITNEIHENSLKVRGGVNMMWLNGVVVQNTEPLALLRLLKRERNLIQQLTELGLDRSQAFGLLTHNIVTNSQKDTGGLDGLLDASDRPEGGGLIVYWNDIEKDSRYASWSPTLYSLLRPSYPGQFLPVKANLYNAILVFDLSQTSSLSFLAGPMFNILERSLPFRFGLVPIVETEEGIKMARLFYHLVGEYGRKTTLGFVRKISQHQIPSSHQTPKVQWDAVRDAYDELIFAEGAGPSAKSFDDVVDGKTTEHTADLDKLHAYSERLATTLATSPTGHAFFNGKHYEFDTPQNFLQNLQTDATYQQQYFQEKIYEGVITDDKINTLGNHFYDLPSTTKRRNRYIFPKNGASDLRILNLPEVLSRTGIALSPKSYIYPDTTEAPVLSVQVVGDFDSEGGLNLVKEALESLATNKIARITFVPNPKDADKVKTGQSTTRLISQLVSQGLLSTTEPLTVSRALGIALTAESSQTDQAALSKDDAILQITKGEEFESKKYAAFLKASQLFAKRAGIKPGVLGLVINGRVVGPIEPNDFRAADFEALVEYELRKRTGPILGALADLASKLAQDKKKFSDTASFASSIVAWVQQPDPSEVGLLESAPKPRQLSYGLLKSEHTAFEYGDNSTAVYHLHVLLDPLSAAGQEWSNTVKWLSSLSDIFIKIYLNPAVYEELPLKRFYRYNLLPSLSFDTNGQEIPAEVVFDDLPLDHIYTLAMDVPTAWLVRPKVSLYDLDNIQLGQLLPGDNSVNAVFTLDALIVDGHAREVDKNTPPRGVELQVVAETGRGQSVPVQDTLVVANLGYFQFRLTPGVFGLEIREGKGRKIFDMESAGGLGWDSPSVAEAGNELVLSSFEGLTLFPTFKRKPGMEKADVLEEDKESTGVFSKVMSMFTGKDSTDVALAKEQADINIFTVASGLLYERFASIMILSVLRNTKSKVKFWFIENFLSPSFLEFIPHMAKEYNFDYQLVTYRWPSWLRAQTEKQRIIWAYKILFLDVLFPMDLKKVIFVDADQIVRADLKELVDLDLHGAPYGYTPMGDDNKDMEGFRFWKTGYWKEFLEGKPYHISALYVIDLVKFRQMAAGDILRQQYQALSADPGSLANLDQDLPNNLQKQVPIFSLPEDWLWCETWCSKDRLHRAKTIDLCQNPLTKEPKLSRARQIPEWEEYDAEIARFTRRLAEEGKIHSGLSTADANVLAGGGSTKAESEKPKEGNIGSEADSVETEERARDEL